eukprot:COSAG05_NODE_646_length_8119_cov_236.689900_14_plen_45_part_00
MCIGIPSSSAMNNNSREYLPVVLATSSTAVRYCSCEYVLDLVPR